MTTVFGKYWGRRDFESASRILAYVLKVAFLTGFVFFAGCLFAPKLILKAFTDVVEIQELGVQYMRFLAPYYLFTAFSEILIELRYLKCR